MDLGAVQCALKAAAAKAGSMASAVGVLVVEGFESMDEPDTGIFVVNYGGSEEATGDCALAARKGTGAMMDDLADSVAVALNSKHADLGTASAGDLAEEYARNSTTAGVPGDVEVFLDHKDQMIKVVSAPETLAYLAQNRHRSSVIDQMICSKRSATKLRDLEARPTFSCTVSVLRANSWGRRDSHATPEGDADGLIQSSATQLPGSSGRSFWGCHDHLSSFRGLRASRSHSQSRPRGCGPYTPLSTRHSAVDGVHD